MQELVAVAWYRRDERLEIGYHLLLGLEGIRPFVARFQNDEVIRDAWRHRVRGNFRAADLRKHPLDLGHLGDSRFELALKIYCLLQRSAGDPKRMHHDVAFIETRYELRAEPRRQPAENADQGSRDGNRQPPEA